MLQCPWLSLTPPVQVRRCLGGGAVLWTICGPLLKLLHYLLTIVNILSNNFPEAFVTQHYEVCMLLNLTVVSYFLPNNIYHV